MLAALGRETRRREVPRAFSPKTRESIDALRPTQTGTDGRYGEAELGAPRPTEAPTTLNCSESQIYVARNSDRELEGAIDRFDSFVLLQGPRQTGKSSLLVRGLDRAQGQGGRIVLTDFQCLPGEAFETLSQFWRALADDLYRQLGLDVRIGESWREERSPNKNLERYLSRRVLAGDASHVVWAWDGVDRLVDVPFGTQVFSFLRTWHNKRALDSRASWDKIAVVMTHSSEPQQFITDINQSPFNVGTRIRLGDFTRLEVEELNHRLGQPLSPNGIEIESFYALFAGHPALTQWGLQALAVRSCSLEELRERALDSAGSIGNHWREFVDAVDDTPQLVTSLCEVANHNRCTDQSAFSRLRALGLISGHSSTTARPRCDLYRSFIRRRWP